MTTKHHDLSPSAFPAWAVCPCFESDPAERADAAAGTAQHAALAAAMAGNEALCRALSPEARESVIWAEGYIRTLAGTNAIHAEHHVTYKAPDSFAAGGMSEVFFGTADAVIIRPPGNLADLIDYKSGADDHEHRAQLAGYALALCGMRTRLKTVRCHVLYGRVRRVDSWSLTPADAAGTVMRILDARRDPARMPAACDYCGFCAARTTCPALVERVAMVAATASSWEDLAPAIREPSAIADPTLAAKAVTLARFVSIWADAVRAKATEMAKGGAILPGYRLQERRGSREVADLATAFNRTGLAPDQFVAACKLSLPKLVEVFAGARGLSKAAAAREIECALADLVREAPSSVSLVVERKGEQ